MTVPNCQFTVDQRLREETTIASSQTNRRYITMSMISPELYIERECKGKSYRELVKIRDEILESVKDYEKGNVSPEAWNIYPSPGTHYQFDLQCLTEVNKLVAEAYSSEVVWGGDDAGMGNGEKEYSIVSLLLETLKAQKNGYKTSTFRLLEEAGYDAEKFSDSDLIGINSLLFEEAPKDGLELDMSARRSAICP